MTPSQTDKLKFLFESAILLFMNGRRKEAGKKAFQTYCSNPYWIDRFFGRTLTSLDIWHPSNLTTIEYTQALVYSVKQPELAEFSEWLKDLLTTTDKERRRMLAQEASQLID